jgi:hypothetical protein
MSAIEANVLEPTSLVLNSPLRYSDHKCSSYCGESCFHRFLPPRISPKCTESPGNCSSFETLGRSVALEHHAADSGCRTR